MPQCWKPHVAAHLLFCFLIKLVKFIYLTTFLIQINITCKHNIKNIDKWYCISTINLHLLQISIIIAKIVRFPIKTFCAVRRDDEISGFCTVPLLTYCVLSASTKGIQIIIKQMSMISKYHKTHFRQTHREESNRKLTFTRHHEDN